MFNPLKKRSNNIVEIRDFFCSDLEKITFKYPIFKGWEPIGMQNTGKSKCTIFLNNKNLKVNHIDTEFAPQIIISQIIHQKAHDQIPDYLNETNINGIHFGRTDTGYDFWLGDGVVNIELLSVIDDYGFSKEQFFKNVIETFRLK